MCPYHGFVFRRGTFCGIHPKPSRRRDSSSSSSSVAATETASWAMGTATDGQLLYVLPGSSEKALELPWVEPEVSDPSFVSIHGACDLDAPQSVVTENLLDMLHITFVHRSFGQVGELPRRIRHDETNNRTTFVYRPRNGSLSTLLAMAPTDVRVENEFHLPSTTVTRVRVNARDIKTIVTRAQPLDERRTRLYWTLHRNFWAWPGLDPVFRRMMEMTLEEDRGILSRVVPLPEGEKHFLSTPYDVTIQRYRDAVRKASKN